MLSDHSDINLNQTPDIPGSLNNLRYKSPMTRKSILKSKIHSILNFPHTKVSPGSKLDKMEQRNTENELSNFKIDKNQKKKLNFRSTRGTLIK